MVYAADSSSDKIAGQCAPVILVANVYRRLLLAGHFSHRSLIRNVVIAFIENNFPFRRTRAPSTVDTNAQASWRSIAVRSCGKFTRNIHSFLMRLDNDNELVITKHTQSLTRARAPLLAPNHIGSVTPSQSDKIEIAKHISRARCLVSARIVCSVPVHLEGTQCSTRCQPSHAFNKLSIRCLQVLLL